VALTLVCSHWVPQELPHFILEEIEQIEDLNLYCLDLFILTLQDFVKDFHRPLTTDPLENDQSVEYLNSDRLCDW
jgi:hypothetical protein